MSLSPTSSGNSMTSTVQTVLLSPMQSPSGLEQPKYTLSLPSLDDNVPLPRDLTSRYRKGTPRSRAGCVTCKARHVKCDEAKPGCKRCHSTGRKCEYVVPPPRKSSPVPADIDLTPQSAASLVIQHQPLFDIPGSYDDRRSFHFIQAKNLTETFGKCEIDLWDSTMLLYSHGSSAVRTSLLALSSIYEVHERKMWLNDRAAITVESLQKTAFAQYTKAVAEIIQSLRASNKPGRSKNDRKAVLLSCLIFTWIEIMLSNFDTARWHLDSGINIINDIATNPAAKEEREDPEDIYGALHRSFLRLRFQTTVGLQAKPAIAPPATQVHDPLGVDGGDVPPRPMRQLTLAKPGLQLNKGPNPELSWTLQGRLRQLERLKRADEETRQKPAHTVSDEDRRRSLTYVYVKLSRAVLSLMTEARSNGPDSLDTSRYVEVIDLIEDIYGRKSGMGASSAALDFGVNPPLVFTLRWCKDITVKCRAYELLRTGSPREGLWYRDDIIQFVDQQGLVWQ